MYMDCANNKKVVEQSYPMGVLHQWLCTSLKRKVKGLAQHSTLDPTPNVLDKVMITYVDDTKIEDVANT